MKHFISALETKINQQKVHNESSVYASLTTFNILSCRIGPFCNR